MMMAHDSSSDADSLSDETRTRLRSALVDYADRPSRGEPLRLALDAVAREAKAKTILPERLLITLKDIWHSLPNVRAMKETDEQVRLLQRVVTMCIKEYYAES